MWDCGKLSPYLPLDMWVNMW